MFHRQHLGASLGQGGGHARIRHSLGRHRNLHHLRQIDAPEHDAGVGRCRAQRDFHALSAVQADAYGVGEGFEGSLFEHRVILVRLFS